jgi:TRAP-type C4-dicarboxylate transport system substrate-binding protein
MLINDLRTGAYDVAWPATRTFPGLGMHGFEAVEAPMTITNHEAMKALVQAPVARRMLDMLDGSGIKGLGLAVGTLRRPFAGQAPLLGPEDWAGARFGTAKSPVQIEAVRALGGNAVPEADEWQSLVEAGELRGNQWDIPQYEWNGFGNAAPFVTANVVLWPKLYVLALNQKRWDSLNTEQQGWVTAAADAAVKASVEGVYDESAMATKLCADSGVRFLEATDDQVAALRAKVQPVIDGLAADPVNGPLLADVQAIAAAHPGVEAPDVPSECRVVDAPRPSPTLPTALATIPNGTYRNTVTTETLDRLDIDNGPGWTGIWTLRIEDGAYQLTCNFLNQPRRDCGNAGSEGDVLEAGYLLGDDDEVTFRGDGELAADVTGCLLPPSMEPGHCIVIDPYSYRWALDGDALTFSDPQPELSAPFHMEPMVRVDG